MVELLLADLAAHIEPDGAVLLELHALKLALSARDLAFEPAVVARLQRREARREQLRLLQHAPHLAPDQLLQPLGADHRVLAAAQAVHPRPVALVVAPRPLELVAVGLAALPHALAAGHVRSHEHPALAAAHEVLEQVEGLRVAGRARQPPLAQLLRPLPRLLVHERREGDAHPALAGLAVPAHPCVGGGVAGLAVPPGALVGLVAEDAVDLRRVPARPRTRRGDAVGLERSGDGGRAHAIVDGVVEDAADDLRAFLVDLWRAALCDAVAVGDSVDGDAALFGRAALPHRGALAEVVELDLADRRHQPEGLHVDRVHHRLDADAVRLHHLHEGGGGVHAAREAVGLPADDDVEAAGRGVGEHALELGAALGPAAPDLLVAGGDGVAALFAVRLHVGQLLGDGGLVVLGLALVGDARVDGGAALSGLAVVGVRSRHGLLLPGNRTTRHLPGRVRER